MKALTGRAEGVQPEADASVVQKADSPTRRLGAATEADFVGKGVKGGVARGIEGGALNAATFPVYRKVRTDSTASAIRTVFELSPGVEVTLTDLTPPPSAPAARQRSNAAAAPVVQSAAPDLKLDSAQSMPVNTVTWTDKRGHTMTLTGRVSTLQMELLRQQLPPEQR